MFPDLVSFEWKKNNDLVTDGEVVEQRKEKTEKTEVTVTSMLIVDEDKATTGPYECTVNHEGPVKTQKLLLKRGNLRKL